MNLPRHFTGLAVQLACLLACFFPLRCVHAQSESSSLAPIEIVTNSTGQTNFAEYVRNHISFYEPIYFALGKPTTEFQYSLKYKITDFKERFNPLTYFYFGFTQTSFWNLLTKDPFFYDSSYKPSLFFFKRNVNHLDDPDDSHLFALDLQAGSEHESNGKGGTGERSIYTAYFQPTFRFQAAPHLELALQPRAYAYYWVGHNNPDIAAYRGYVDLQAALTWDAPTGQRYELYSKITLGDAGTHPGVLTGLRFNLPVKSKFNPNFQFQYFAGYGQSFLQYNQYSRAFRGGLCLTY